MEKLLEALQEKGVDASSMTDEQVVGVAKACGLEPLDFLPREIEIVEYTNKREETNLFVKTPPVIVSRKEDGLAQTVRGQFLRVDALDQTIADLQRAREMLTDSQDEE